MEAHAGTIGIRTGRTRKPQVSLLSLLRESIRRHRQERARRAHALRVNGARAPFVPGSEHTHLLPRGKSF
jgi:hypothetical protein